MIITKLLLILPENDEELIKIRTLNSIPFLPNKPYPIYALYLPVNVEDLTELQFE